MNFIKTNIKNIIIGLLLILFLCSSVIIFYLTRHKEEESIKELVGTVIVTDSAYVIIKTAMEDYLISNIKGEYNIGDEVKFSYLSSDLSDKEGIKTIKINDEELIKASYIEENNNKEESTNNNINSNSINKPNNSTSNNLNNPTNNITNEDNTSVDTQVLSYFNDLKSDFESTNITDRIKSGFITAVDFLFYEGKIKGYTFADLSNSAKLKVLAMGLYFDTKIEKYFPGYKESITSTTSKIYTNIKEKIVTTYLELTTTICANNSELCIEAKTGFENLKTNFGLTWSLIKDIAGDGLSNLKSWYEIWSGK